MDGANTVRNGGDDANTSTVGDEDLSISAFHGAQIRQNSNGHSVFIGSIQAGNQSLVSLRDPEITGGFALNDNSRIEIRGSSRASRSTKNERP